MAAKLIDIKEAAEILGVTVDQLNDMRSRGEVHGYRDGGSWKFKTDEIERVITARGETLSDPFGTEEVSLKDPEGLTDAELTVFRHGREQPISSVDDESILVSEEALGHSAESTSSTVIGKGKKGQSPHDSDIQLASEPAAAGGSDVALVPDAGGGSDVKLVAGGSDVHKAGGSDVFRGDSDKLKKGPSDTGKIGGSDLSLDDDPLDLSVGSSLTLGDELEERPIKAPGSSISDAGSSVSGRGSSVSGRGSSVSGHGSSVSGQVLADDDDDLVLGGSGAGSDLTLGGGGSGINLKPTDSGLSLEQPLDLGGGSAVESLELPEDDDMISLDEESADPDAATQLKADDEFLLTPVEESFIDDDSSGSQVIALEDSEAYADENAKTMLGPQAARQGGLDSASDPFGAGLETLSPAGAGGAAMVAQPVMAAAPAPMAPAAMPEAPYSIWNVLALMFIVVFLGVTGMLMTDLVRNIWSFDSAFPATTSFMDWWIEVFKLEP